MKIQSIDLTYLDLPFTPHTDKHLKYWLPHWHIVQICRLTMDNGIVGIGETIPNYTWCKVPQDIEERVVGREAASLMWDRSLGAGVEMAIFDAIAKHQNVPVYQLLGTKVRDYVPLSWWNMDMPAADWAQQCAEAHKAGYTSAKLKARTWHDVPAAVQAILKVVPPQFHLDFDYNGTLDNAANAVIHLKSMEQYPQVAMIESPIPQNDVIGSRQIRSRINKAIAMHYGSPPIITALDQDVTDGFVVGGDVRSIAEQTALADAANKPYWLQLVGTGITTTWAAHLGAVHKAAKWPAITCMNIWKEQLIKDKIVLRGGYHRVPEKPGLGIELDEKTINKFTVDYDWVDKPRHVYRYQRASGEVVYFGCSKEEITRVYPNNAMPICEVGSSLLPYEDDGSKQFKQVWDAVQDGNTLRRFEGKKRAKSKKK
jgi:L-alanine-DL-glutamate epimerase-like enolase superfamily enzyme